MDQPIISKYKTLLLNIGTKQDHAEIYALLDEIEALSYHSGGDVEKSVRGACSKITSRSIREIFLSMSNDLKITSIIDIKKEIAAMYPVLITVAVSLNESAIADIISWLKHSASEYAFLDLYVDPSILGGILLSVNGVYKDFSINGALSSLDLRLIAL